MPTSFYDTKKAHLSVCFFVSMGYKKDVFDVLAYGFELLQNGISLCDMI